jgi:DNA-binding NtrC family response regulator
MLVTSVFILDDEDDIVEELAECLDAAGISCLAGTDPVEARTHLLTNDEICVLLTDIRMPSINGMDLAREVMVRRRDENALEVIILSGWEYKAAIKEEADTCGC